MRTWTALQAHLASRDVARVIYGAIVGLALVVVLEDHPGPAGEVVAALAATALSVGLAELYSEAVAAEARMRRPVPLSALGRYARDALPVTFGAAFPCVFFVLAAAGAMSRDAAFTWAKWTGLALIGGYGFLAARLAGAHPARALLHGGVVATIGVLVIVVKALVH
jgi:hypothetical protein